MRRVLVRATSRSASVRVPAATASRTCGSKKCRERQSHLERDDT
jgi:hypothetical protein